MSDKTPIILDTDIGSDIDDAVALAYLLKQPLCELVGVTTVTGDTAQRGALASVVCEAAGRSDVPIYAGATGPLLHGPGQPEVPQYEAIRGRTHRSDFEPGEAIGFLRDTIRARPHGITLLAVGPLTNVALLFANDPQIASLLSSLVLMNGFFTDQRRPRVNGREHNAIVDPIATAITYRAHPPDFTSVGLDVTLQCSLDAEGCRTRFAEAGGPLALVADMAEVWFRRCPSITFHDPLAAAIIFEPGLCEYEQGNVSVDPGPGGAAGSTSWQPGNDAGPHRIATHVDPEAFFAHYFAVVNMPPRRPTPGG